MNKAKWTMKEIVEDYHNHQNWQLHSSDEFIPLNIVLKIMKKASFGNPNDREEIMKELNSSNTDSKNKCNTCEEESDGVPDCVIDGACSQSNEKGKK